MPSPGRIAAASRPAALPAEPAARYGALVAWRADDSVVNAGVVDSIPSYFGLSAPLLPGGTKKSAPVANANLNNKMAVPSAGGVGYAASLTVPAACTVVHVWRYAAGNAAAFAFTVGGVLNTAQSQLKASNALFTRAMSPAFENATTGIVDAALSAVSGGQYVVGSKVAGFHNSKTNQLSTNNITAITGDQFRIMDLDSSGTFGLSGAWARTIIYPSILTAGQLGYVLDWLGAEYGITISP